MEQNKLPDFFVLGPPKTASTSLHYYLGQHPEIFMSPKKETRFFDLDYAKGISFYQKYFEEVSGQHCIGEATPTYAFLPFVAERIYKFNPSAKLIFTFRNPVERAYSGWLMRSAKGNEKLSFRDAMADNLQQRSRIDFYGEDITDAWLKDQRGLGKRNEITLRTYIEGGLYSQQLAAYEKYFSLNQFHTILMDDIRQDVDGVLKNLFEFLGVDPSFTCTAYTIKNVHNKNRLKFLFNIFGKEAVLKTGKMLPRNLKEKVLSKIKVPQEKLALKEEDRKYAYGIFKEEINTLEKKLNLHLDNWKMKD